MVIERWNPFREMSELQHEVNRLFNGSPLSRRYAQDGETAEACQWAPPVDIFEQAERVLLRVELPGLEKDDIRVDVENGLLSIRGEKKSLLGQEDTTYHRVESRFGTFCRTFTLPDSLDPEKIDASYKNGVLTLGLARKQEALPKKVDVKIA